MKNLISILFGIISFSGIGQMFESGIEISKAYSVDYSYHVDIDSDSDVDVVGISTILNTDLANLFVYKNDGNGVFSSDADFLTEIISSSGEIFLHDIDNDGDQDFFSSDYNESVFFYENNGAGVFESPVQIAEPENGAKNLHFADLNGDGNDDIIAFSQDSSRVFWIENDGLFINQYDISLNSSLGGDAKAVDFDYDGDVDLVYHHSGTLELYFLENDGLGFFEQEQLLLGDLITLAFSISDVNSDGILDLISNNYGSYYYHKGLSNLSFEEPELITSDGNQQAKFDFVDFDSDGDLDFIYFSVEEQSLRALEFDEQEIFTNEMELLNLSDFPGAEVNPTYDVQDYNGDNEVDIVIEKFSDFIYCQNSGEFTFPESFRFSNYLGLVKPIFADLNADGYNDFVVKSGSELGWFENTGIASFESLRTIDFNSNAMDFRCFDANSNGYIDIVILSDSGCWLYSNLGNGEFSEPEILFSSTGTIMFEVGDLDGDGDVDMVTQRDGVNSITSIRIFLNTGDGVFNYSAAPFSDQYIHFNGMQISDLDGDLDMDILAYGVSSAWLDSPTAIVIEKIGGSWTSHEINTPYSPTSEILFPIDLYGDNKPELINEIWNGSVTVWSNLALFDYNVDSSFPSSSEMAGIADVDGDGFTDVMCRQNIYDEDLRLFLNNGFGEFNESLSDSIEISFNSLFQDIDNDGKRDLIEYNSSTILWRKNIIGYYGCTDVNACNYSEIFQEDDGTCCYGTCGCDNQDAQNYSEYYDCEVECLFNISGVVFYDENQNGTREPEEIGLPNYQITVQPLGFSIYTNDLGEYSFLSEEDLFSIEVSHTESFPFSSGDNPLVIDPQQMESSIYNFGLTIEELPNYDLNVILYPDGNTFVCNDEFEYNIAFTNEGNATVNGIIEFTYDELFQGYNPITPLDSTLDNSIFMGFDELMPGQTEVFSIDLITPLVNSIGLEVTNNVSVTGFYNGEQVSFGEDSLTMEIACAYDPNDKQAFPLGYTDNHWLLNGTDQEFLVRFQNTGNAPAQNVRIQDTIDVNYDLSTFELKANSHSVMTTINEQTRVVDFFFENIQLPDSINNEPESHGLVAYSISPVEDLPVGTVLENTAYIYFDNNEPIITNTTWNTIHECGGEAAFALTANAICVGEEVSIESSYEVIENYYWQLNGDSLSSEPLADHLFEEAGTFEVSLEASNPLCTDSQSQTITVYDYPIAEITENGAILTASEAESYQWLLNGEELEGATEQTLLPTEDGAYSVIVTNEGNCSSTSAEVIIVSISELGSSPILIYPNPMTDVAFIDFKDAQTRTVKLLDSQGKEVLIWNNIATQRLEIQKGNLPAGNYVVSVLEGNDELSIQLVVQ